MNKNHLVSIITPCYNGQKHLKRFLDSILTQTYKNIELIFVNDGSTDKTEEILLKSKTRFDEEGISLTYINQENTGLGGAINAGLKKVTGEYLCWPDSDDYLEPESVELRVKILDENPEYAIVASDAYLISENDLKVTGLVSSSYTANQEHDQFIHLLKGNSFICSGCFMIRTKVFFDTHPSGEIYPSRRGQNYQMLLPVYYKHKRFFLNKPLYNYVRYSSGLSGGEDTSFDEFVNTYNYQKEIILRILSDMEIPDNEKQSYNDIVHKRYSNLIFRMAYIKGSFETLLKEYSHMRTGNHVSAKVRLRYQIALFKKFFGIAPFPKNN